MAGDLTGPGALTLGSERRAFSTCESPCVQTVGNTSAIPAQVDWQQVPQLFSALFSFPLNGDTALMPWAVASMQQRAVILARRGGLAQGQGASLRVKGTGCWLPQHAQALPCSEPLSGPQLPVL